MVLERMDPYYMRKLGHWQPEEYGTEINNALLGKLADYPSCLLNYDSRSNRSQAYVLGLFVLTFVDFMSSIVYF